MQTLQGALGNVFGQGGGAPTSGGSPATWQGTLPNIGSTGSQSGTFGNWDTTSLGSPTDSSTQALIALMQGNKSNPWLSAIAGLGPVGAQVIQAALREPEFGGLMHPATPSVSQPGPLQFGAGAPPASPVQEAQLIEALL